MQGLLFSHFHTKTYCAAGVRAKKACLILTKDEPEHRYLNVINGISYVVSLNAFFFEFIVL